MLLWRDVATEAIAERQAAQHLAALQRSREALRLAKDFAKKRLRSKAWLSLRRQKNLKRHNQIRIFISTCVYFVSHVYVNSYCIYIYIRYPNIIRLNVTEFVLGLRTWGLAVRELRSQQAASLVAAKASAFLARDPDQFESQAEQVESKRPLATGAKVKAN